MLDLTGKNALVTGIALVIAPIAWVSQQLHKAGPISTTYLLMSEAGWRKSLNW